MVEHATDDNTVQRMRFACWITKATGTHAEYVIFISFILQKWLRERASVLRHTFIAYIVKHRYTNSIRNTRII
jgi:hypothetical protein